MISMPLVHSVQIVHLSCAEINTISERTKTSFHLTDVILSLIGCAQHDFHAHGNIRCTPCTYLATRLTLSKQMKTIFTWSTPPRSTIWCAQKRFQSLWYIWRKPCTYLASRLIRSQNRPKWASTWPTSPRRTIGCAWKRFPRLCYIACIQNDFQAYGTFSANRAPIWHRD
jgi:hypothetical protein